MTEKPATAYQPNRKKGRDRFSDGLITAGALILYCVALFVVKGTLAIGQQSGQAFLASSLNLSQLLPLPLPTLTPEPAPEGQANAPKPELQDLFLPLVSSVDPQTLAAEAEQPPGSSQPAPVTGPIIRLVIPKLKINRAVVIVNLRKDANGSRQWNTDPLFANQNRTDLVGQLAVSLNPGEGGNIILVGHNYNNGWFGQGAFIHIDQLSPGDSITLYTENNGVFNYTVEKVVKVPWQEQNANEMEKHQKYLWPTESEQLTLVTCGGSYLLSWSARIYVVALPAGG
jgi:LPXTG-site transpeptidase (sortase) family protein